MKTSRIRMTFGLMLIALVGACGGGAVTSPPPSAVAAADVRVAAADNRFDPATINLPADQAASLLFENRDGEDHNVAIYRDATASSELFRGDTINATWVMYEVPALPAGTWFFRCDVHPDMTGSVVAGG